MMLRTMFKVAMFGLILLISTPCFSEGSNVDDFAEFLLKTIENGDKYEFEKLLRSQDRIDVEEQIEYVFNIDDGKFSIRSFILNHPIKTYTAPFLNENGDETNHYVIVFYDPRLIDFSEPLRRQDLVSYWNIGYVETKVICRKGDWVFEDSAFYQGTSPPWVEDY